MHMYCMCVDTTTCNLIGPWKLWIKTMYTSYQISSYTCTQCTYVAWNNSHVYYSPRLAIHHTRHICKHTCALPPWWFKHQNMRPCLHPLTVELQSDLSSSWATKPILCTADVGPSVTTGDRAESQVIDDHYAIHQLCNWNIIYDKWHNYDVTEVLHWVGLHECVGHSWTITHIH